MDDIKDCELQISALKRSLEILTEQLTLADLMTQTNIYTAINDIHLQITALQEKLQNLTNINRHCAGCDGSDNWD